MAYQYAKKGANIILTGRRLEALETVQKRCIALGVNSWCRTVDMEKPETIDELAKWIYSEGHEIDHVLLNAGISQRSLTLETDISVDRRLMEVNYFGGIYLVKALKEMGFAMEQVYTTMELRMKCGVGKCGRCNIGTKYVCKDGPVFDSKEVDWNA